MMKTRIAAICVFFLLSCTRIPSQHANIITIKGSDTMLPLINIWAVEFMKTHPGVSVYSDGGGTSTGVQALIENRVDVCAASRSLHSEELQKLAEKHRQTFHAG